MRINTKLFFIVSLFLLFRLEVYSQKILQSLQTKFGSSNVTFKDSSSFKEYYEIKFRQPIDHADTTKGFFMQTLFLGHNDASKPVVLETNGYENLPYQNLKYVAEPTNIFNANQIIAEHRYFGNSIPDSNNNAYLNAKQIAGDYHNIKIAFNDLYKSDWISTGASKGGVTSLYYSFYYPDDVAASFVYVAPVVESLEDKRITNFLDEKRKTEDGKNLFKIQQDLLNRKQILMPTFLEILKLSNLNIGTMDPETLYDFGVLEFDFNYWQYISDFNLLLSLNTKALEVMTSKGLDTSNLFSQSDSMLATFPMCVWYLLDEKLSEPFFYQAFTEQGTYGYREELFSGLKKTNYSPEFLAGNHPEYSWKFIKSFNKFLEKDLSHSILVYGAEDPWTACHVNVSSTSENIIIINPKTNHMTQIHDVGDKEKQQIREKLSKWTNASFTIN